MGILISEPSDYNPATIDWQNLLFKLTATTGGLLLLDITKTSDPRICMGSRIEINGSFFKCDQDYPIRGFVELRNSRFVWIYAEVIGNSFGGTAQLIYSASFTSPTWQVAKGGWYDDYNRRCIAYVFKNDQGILSSWITMALPELNLEASPPDFPDVNFEELNLEAEARDGAFVEWSPAIDSWYLVRIAGATGGRGGRGRFCHDKNTLAGVAAAPANGQLLTQWLFMSSQNTYRLASGTMGSSGGYAPAGNNANVGSGGAGGINAGYPLLQAGNGTNGVHSANGRNRSAGGGGGGGGGGSCLLRSGNVILIARGSNGTYGTVGGCTMWVSTGPYSQTQIQITGGMGRGGGASQMGTLLPNRPSAGHGFVEIYSMIE